MSLTQKQLNQLEYLGSMEFLTPREEAEYVKLLRLQSYATQDAYAMQAKYATSEQREEDSQINAWRHAFNRQAI
jgi:hypothetical protein